MYANTIKGCQVRQQIHVGFTAMVENLVANLHSVGYADTTVSFYEQAAVHFSFWLTRRSISPSQLKENHLDGFLSRVPRCHCPFGGVRLLLRGTRILRHTAATRMLRRVRPATSRCCCPAVANQGGPVSVTTPMTKRVQDYLSLRRAFGFHLCIAGHFRPLQASPTAKHRANPSQSSWPSVGRSHHRPGSRSLLRGGS
jgi:hypothetical protein